MNGLSRTFFAVTAAVLRALAWPPFIAADRLTEIATWCDQQAKS